MAPSEHGRRRERGGAAGVESARRERVGQGVESARRKRAPAAGDRRRKGKDPVGGDHLPLDRSNLILFAIALGVIVLGYVVLARGSITLAPILLVLGYCVLVPLAIVYRPRSRGEAEGTLPDRPLPGPGSEGE